MRDRLHSVAVRGLDRRPQLARLWLVGVFTLACHSGDAVHPGQESRVDGAVSDGGGREGGAPGLGTDGGPGSDGGGPGAGGIHLVGAFTSGTVVGSAGGITLRGHILWHAAVRGEANGVKLEGTLY